ncbi:hypothetical protein QG37_06313 [Candidozyma auris]|nr:hypothetical protein QG37_06313 [[Candida] auris]
MSSKKRDGAWEWTAACMQYSLSLSLSQKNQLEVSRFLLRFDTYAVKVGTQRTHKVSPYLLYFSFKQCNIAWLESANFKVLTRGALIM